MLSSVPMILQLPPASYRDVKGAADAVPARRDHLISWFRQGQAVFSALESVARPEVGGVLKDQLEPLRGLTRHTLNNLLWVQGLFKAAEYPSSWATDLSILFNRGDAYSGKGEHARAERLAHYLNPSWTPSILVAEVHRLRKQVAPDGVFPQLSSYSQQRWLQSFKVANRMLAKPDVFAALRCPSAFGEGSSGDVRNPVGFAPQLELDSVAKERVNQAFNFIEQLAVWRSGAPFEGYVDRGLVALGLTVRALQEVKPGRGEWDKLTAYTGLNLYFMQKHLATLFPPEAEGRRAEQLAALRRSIEGREAGGRLRDLRTAAKEVLELSGVSRFGKEKRTLAVDSAGVTGTARGTAQR